MIRKKNYIICFVFCILWLSAGLTWAQTEGGVEDGKNADVFIGIAVDYMGKIKFQVLDEMTHGPIEGATVELYMSSLDRYILVGLTDENGILDLDITLGQLIGNQVKYRVYKFGWRPMPVYGELIMEETPSIEPHIITVFLNRYRSNGSGGGSKYPTVSSTKPDETTPSTEGSGIGAGDQDQNTENSDTAGVGTGVNNLPKTGVESHSVFWAMAFVLFLFAGIILIYLYNREKKAERRK